MIDFKHLSPNSVISLMAPTACGKTAFAYELYDSGRFELISVDSALIYQDMNIGTAKPTDAELLKYPHHLVNIISPTESYNVSTFCNDVSALINIIHQRNKIPLLVGGTMMYYMAMFEGISNIPETDFLIRQEVESIRQDKGVEFLYDYLILKDPKIAHRLNVSDTQRITRAVEVFKQTGKPLSEWQAMPKQAISHNLEQEWIGISVMPDRQWLHDRIALRLDIMWQEGFLEEVIELISNYSLTANMASMRCVGYRQVIDYLASQGYINMPVTGNEVLTLNTNKNDTIKKLNYDLLGDKDACQEMQNKALYATRQLAKRQYTWLRKMNNENFENQSQANKTKSNITMYSFKSIKEVQELFI